MNKKICLLLAGSLVLSASGWAQGTKGSMLRIIKKTTQSTLPSKATQFSARVINDHKLAYPKEQLDQMMHKDRTETEDILLGRVPLRKEALEAVILEKTYEVMPGDIKPTLRKQLSAAMLSSEQTAQRVAENGGGAKFNIMSPEYAIQTYYQRMREFAELKKYVDIKMFYFKADGVSAQNIPSHERFRMTQAVSDMRLHLKFLALYYFPEDMPLYLAGKYLTQRMIELQPALAGVLDKMPSFVRQDRQYLRSEFMLQDPPSPAQVQPLPDGLKIAVVNDDPDILFAMSNYGRWGSFGAGAQVSTFDSIYKLGAAIKEGTKYDIIFTDISMPNGSGMLFVNKLRENNINVPVIGLSGYKEEQVKGQDLFEIGFDGYVRSDEYGYRNAPNALKNYFYYRALNKWAR